jgi:hypothetical protein
LADKNFAAQAEMALRLICNQELQGSIPWRGTKTGTEDDTPPTQATALTQGP